MRETLLLIFLGMIALSSLGFCIWLAFIDTQLEDCQKSRAFYWNNFCVNKGETCYPRSKIEKLIKASKK